MTGVRRFSAPQSFVLASSFVVTLGSFAVLPYMSVLLHDQLGMGLGAVGAVLALTSLLQFAGCVPGAAVAERIGLQPAMLLALVLHVAGFLGFLAGLRWPTATVVGLVSLSAGAALYLPATKAYLVHGVDPDRRPLLLSAGSSASNAGVALGPMAAGPFVLDASAGLFTTAVLLFAALTAAHVLLPRESDDPRGPHVDPPWRVLSGIPVLPFAVAALTAYLHMYFYYYLPVYTVPRASTAFYGAVLMLHSLILVVLTPLLAGWIARLGYPGAVLTGFTTMAAGLTVLVLETRAAILTGAVLICLGEVVLFLRTDLEALARSHRSPAVVFGQQRLAFGIGAATSGALGGVGYDALDGTGHAPLFWLVVAGQCLLLPPLLLAAHRLRSRVLSQPDTTSPGGKHVH